VLATASEMGWLSFWDVATGKQLRQVSLALDRRSRHRLHRVAFSPDGKLLAVGAHGASTRLWDVAREAFVRTLPVGGAFAFSPDSKVLAVAEADQVIRLWDVNTGKVMRELRGQEGAVRALLFSPDGKLLASGGAGATLLWKVR
jgi:WD40 repeat protein